MDQQQALFTSPLKASNIIGADVVNPERENLGSIKEIVIDPSTGQVAYAVVSFGGFMGVGTKLFAIPFSVFAYTESENEYVLNVAKDRLKEAPGFDADRWPSMNDEKWNRDMFSYYDRAPYWE